MSLLSETQMKHLSYLPDLERKIILAVLKGAKQKDLGTKYNMSQAAISLRLKKAKRRLSFLEEFPTLNKSEVRKGLKSSGFNPAVIESLCVLYFSTCQSEVKRKLGFPSQGRVRHYLWQSVKVLNALVKEGQSELEPLLRGLTLIRDNPGILHSYTNHQVKKS